MSEATIVARMSVAFGGDVNEPVTVYCTQRSENCFEVHVGGGLLADGRDKATFNTFDVAAGEMAYQARQAFRGH